jgi:hypothetical protein
MACIYMLSTCYRNNNSPNLWLDLNFQLKKKDIYKTKLQHIYTKYIVQWTFEFEKYGLVCCLCLYIHAFLCMDFIWDIL